MTNNIMGISIDNQIFSFCFSILPLSQDGNYTKVVIFVQFFNMSISVLFRRLLCEHNIR